MIDYVKKGFNVVWLKGGDFYIFGRGVEEVEKLFENNIFFEVILGISLFCFVFIFVGIFIIYRKFVCEFYVFIGYMCNDEELNWNVIFKFDGILVFFMLVENVENIL